MRDELVHIVDAAMADAARRSARHLACRPGCAQCCHGVFAISGADAGRLRAGLVELRTGDPSRAEHVLGRVAEAVARLSTGFPGNVSTGRLADFDDPANEPLAQLFEEFGNEEPCPALDPATLTCDLYAHRPMLCRTFGPPMRDADGHLGHCELCFTRASQDEVVAAAVDPEVNELWERIDGAEGGSVHDQGQTTVAFALRDG